MKQVQDHVQQWLVISVEPSGSAINLLINLMGHSP
jgi:hypothetical protein